MLRLIDTITLAGIELVDWKIHCATGVASSPLDAFFAGTFEQWQGEQNNKNFECQQILSLIHLGNTRWLFAGAYEVLGRSDGRPGFPSGYTYATREVGGLEHLAGRAIVHFEKTFRASYLKGPKFADRILISAILDQRMSIRDFPGYKSVLITHGQLQGIVSQLQPSWKAALSSVGGVYVITDTATGRHYVGSAAGSGGFWGRWESYARSGHGGNVDLKRLLSAEGRQRAESFTYSILEVCDIDAGEEHVLARESHWKNVLKTREFGLNSN